MQPRVIVTASLDEQVDEYLDAVREAGGNPIRLDALADPDAALADADALLVTGGVDVHPSRYGAPNSRLIDETELERDVFEEALLWDARKRGLPTLCICRGLQIANVAFGGTLIADIPTTFPDSKVRHREPGPDGKNLRGLLESHVVLVDDDAMFAGIIGGTHVMTGARHHQAVDATATDLRAVGHTPDGIVEVLEARFDSPFWIAVQWHPESTRALDDGASRALFAAFVNSAR